MMARSHCWATRGDCIATMPRMPSTMNGMGPRVAIDHAAPMASDTTNSATETTFKRVSCVTIEAICCSLLYSRVRFEFSDDLIECESGGGGVGQDAGDKRAPPPLVFARRPGLGRRGGHERPDAAAGFEDARPFELCVHAGNRVGVDAEVDGQLADRGQLDARGEAARRDRRPQPAFELRVDGRPVARVDRDDAHE